MEQDKQELCDIELRYHLENRIMAAVTAGETENALRLTEESAVFPFENLEVLNVLLRKAAERGGVLPFNLEQLFSSWQRELKKKADRKQQLQNMVESYCNAVKGGTQNSYTPPVKKAISYIHLNLSCVLNLRSIAKALSISPSYLSSLFRKETGLTLTAYIHRQRMALAMDLLRETSMQVQSISLECGFEDVHYFSRLFRRIVGVSPQTYRQGKTLDTP